MLRLKKYWKGALFIAALVLGLIIVTLRIRAAEIPFGLRNTVTSTFDGAYSVHVDDVDGDGDQDLLGAAGWDNQILWWENTAGNGSSWAEHTIAGALNEARSVYTADIDRDGDVDVVGAAAGNSDNVAWWENTAGNGSAWTQHAIDSTFDGAVSVIVLDLDRDGDDDVVGAAADDDEIAWFENDNGDGSSWTTHTIDNTFVEPYFVHSGDIDRDGDLDVLGAGQGNKISWFEDVNGNSLTWSEHVISDTLTAATSVQAVDVDRDGDLDVLGTARDINTIAWWENVNGDGSVWNEQLVDNTFTGVWMAHATDLDRDGDFDIIGAAFTGDKVAWWENVDGGGSAWLIHEVDVSFEGAKYVFPADIDGDGDVEIFSVAFDDTEVAWWDNETIHRNAHFLGNEAVDSAFDGAYSVINSDVDGDGDLDILGVATDGNSLAWFENVNGDGSAWSTHTIDNNFDGALAIDTSDIDSDGDLDVIGAARYDNEISWWENVNGDGSTWSKTTVVTNFDTAISVDTIDMDQDGDQDIIGAAREGDEVAWWENTSGNGSTWTKHSVDNSIDGIRHIRSLDLDSDGDPDIVGVAAASSDDVIWRENTAGNGSSWSKVTIENNFVGGVVIDPVDMDNDGDIDVLGGSYNLNDIIWWENTNGGGTAWSPHVVDGDFIGLREVFAFDMDADGDLDIIGAAQTANEIAWWDNTIGDGTAWIKNILINNFSDAWSVVAGDIDRDGDLDILGAGRLDDEISWWENCGGQFSLLLNITAPSEMDPSDIDDLLRVTAVHNGRAGDHDIELTAFGVLLEEQPGDPLTTAEANAVIENLFIYLDDGSGIFELGSDTLVTTIGSLNLNNGLQLIPFADGDGNVQIMFNQGSKVYFFVVEIAADPASNPDWNNVETLFATFLHDPSTAEDRDYDIPLTQDCRNDVTAGVTLDIIIPEPTSTATSTPTSTSTPTVTPTPTPTATSTPTPTATSTPTPTPTMTPPPPIPEYKQYIPVVYQYPIIQ